MWDQRGRTAPLSSIEITCMISGGRVDMFRGSGIDRRGWPSDISQQLPSRSLIESLSMRNDDHEVHTSSV